MQPQLNSLSILANAPVDVEFGDYRLPLTPLTTLEAQQVIALVGAQLPLVALVKTPEDAFALLADHGDRLVRAVAVAARLPLDQVQALTPDVFVELLLGVVEVNADFFIARTSRLAQRVERVRARLPSAGTTPSPA